MSWTILAWLSLHGCAPEKPSVAASPPPTALQGERRPLGAPFATAAPPGPPRGGPPGGGPPGGASGGGPGTDALGLAFNNADSLCHTGDGAVHTLFVEEGALKHARNGVPDAVLSEGPVSLLSIGSDGKSVVLAVWAEGKPPSIKLSWSADNGKNWSPASTLAKTGTAPSVRVWRSGNETVAAVAWHQGKGPGDESTHVWAATYAGGAWSAPQQIDRSTRGAAWASLGGYGDKTWVVWRDDRAGDGKRWYLYMSAWDGKSWDNERALNIEGHDPSVCMTDNGRMHIGYHHGIEALYTSSDDGGKTWAEPKLLDQGLFVQAECSGNSVALVYERMAKQGSFLDPANKGVGLYLSDDAGKTFQSVPVAKGATGMVRPSAAFTPEGLTVEWVDRSGTTPKLGTEKVALGGK